MQIVEYVMEDLDGLPAVSKDHAFIQSVSHFVLTVYELLKKQE